MKHSLRSGFTLMEFLIFLAILGILGSTIIGVLISTQDARIRQRSVAELEQQGASILHTMTRRIRRAERIIDPPAQQSGSMLLLQMASPSEYPTIFTLNGSGQLFMAQATAIDALLPPTLHVENLHFFNASTTYGRSLLLSFELVTTIPLLQPKEYRKRFETAVTLYPDDQSEAGGCGSCGTPTCINGVYSWNYCLNDVCTAAPVTLTCE